MNDMRLAPAVCGATLLRTLVGPLPPLPKDIVVCRAAADTRASPNFALRLESVEFLAPIPGHRASNNPYQTLLLGSVSVEP